MRGVCSWTSRVSVLLLLLHCSELLDSQHTTDHRKVPQRAENGDTPGSWGAWGPWSSCSRTCGNGVQEQTRACLPVYMQGSRGAGVQLQHPGRIIPALRPGASLHSDGGRAFNSSRDTRRGKQTRPAERSRVTSILPGKYGYGRGAYVVPLQTDAGRRSEAPRLHKQRRSAAATSHHPSARSRGSFRSNSMNNLHRFSRPTHSNAQHLRHNQVWAPLYQPTSSDKARGQLEVHPGSQQQHQERPYNPLPTSSCSGEHAHHRICNSNACPPSSRHIRVLQCSSYNKQPFMGRLYKWEPFNEVQEEQLCELHCRALGFRFYVRHSEKVIDGTPCGQNDTSLCVDGRCTVKGKMTTG